MAICQRNLIKTCLFQRIQLLEHYTDILSDILILFNCLLTLFILFFKQLTHHFRAAVCQVFLYSRY